MEMFSLRMSKSEYLDYPCVLKVFKRMYSCIIAGRCNLEFAIMNCGPKFD
jgi:hypothetical protein